MNLVTSTSLICVLTISVMLFDKSVGRSTECNDDGDCGESDFCHYKYKKCRRGKQLCRIFQLNNNDEYFICNL